MHRSLLLTILILVLIFGAGGQCSQFEQINPCDPGSPNFKLSTVIGTVKSKVTKVPIGKATVDLKLTGVEDSSTETNEEGKFTFSDIEPCRTYTLIAARGDYGQESKDVTTETGEIYEVAFELEDTQIPTIDHTRIPSADFQDKVEIIATITDNEMVSKAKAFYKISDDNSPAESVKQEIIGDDSFTELASPDISGDSYTWLIPSKNVVPPGINYYIYAEDVSGKSATSGSKDEPHRIVVEADLIPPTLEVYQPTGDMITTESDLVVAGKADLGASVTVNEVSVTPSSTTGEFNITISLTEGENTITVTVTDKAGNTTTIVRTVTLDTVAPATPNVTGITPTDDTTPTWTWTSGGGGGNGTYRYKLDNSDLSTGVTKTTDSSYTSTTALSEGTYTTICAS